MLRSMYSGINGMKNFQIKLDVIGNNIANVNTHGFKKGRVMFKDMVSQSIKGANAPGDTRGGSNPQQVGLGSQLAAIDTLHTTGSLQTTGRTLDLSISGDGFFQVNDGDTTYYTRAGNFYMDQLGRVVTVDGLFVQADGGGNIEIPVTAQSINIGRSGVVSIINADGDLEEIATIGVTKFANPDGLEKIGGNLFRESLNSGPPDENTGIPGEEGRGFLVTGTLEMSNVDLSEEFSEMIVAQRGFQANTRIITTSDEILQELMSMKR